MGENMNKNRLFLERLNSLMDKKQETWIEVSDKCKIGRNQRRYWEKNGNIPDGETIINLALHFNVSTDYLLGVTTWDDNTTAKEKEPETALDSQIRELVHLFSECDARGQFSIISTAMEEYDRSQREKNAHMA